MTNLLEFICQQKSGVIALPRNRGIIVCKQQPETIPAGWGFISSDTVTPDLLQDMVNKINMDSSGKKL